MDNNGEVIELMLDEKNLGRLNDGHGTKIDVQNRKGICA